MSVSANETICSGVIWLVLMKFEDEESIRGPGLITVGLVLSLEFARLFCI